MTIRDTDRRGGIPTASPEDRDRKSRTYGRRVSKVTASRGCSQTEANKLLKRLIALTAHHEPPYTEPYVRWCGRTAGVIPPPTRCAPGMAHGAQAPFTGLWWSGGDSGVLVF